jgi:hypothetical protein
LSRGGSVTEAQCRQLRGWSLVGSFTLFALLGPAITKPDNAEGQSIFRLVQSSPLWKRTITPVQKPEEFFRTATGLGMSELIPSMKARPERSPRDLNVLLIFQESTYNRHLSLFGGTNDTQPRLSKYRFHPCPLRNVYGALSRVGFWPVYAQSGPREECF